MRKLLLFTVAALSFIVFGDTRSAIRLIAQSNANTIVNPNTYQDLRWRSIGPISSRVWRLPPPVRVRVGSMGHREKSDRKLYRTSRRSAR